MNPLQRDVATFAQTHRLETDVPHRLLDAVSELGEVAKEVLKSSRYGAAAFSLLCVAHTAGVDLDAAVRAAMEKYARRLATTGQAASGA